MGVEKKIRKRTIIKLFVALGFKTAKTWDEKKILSKIKELPELVDGVTIKNAKMRSILNSILSADEVVIIESETGESEQPSEETKSEETKSEETKTTKKKKKVSKKKEVTKKETKKDTKRSSKKSDNEKDVFGSCVGSNNAVLNKCLSKTPKKMSQLVKEAKLTGTYYTHLGDLIKKKLVEKTKEGFIIISNSK